MAPQFFFLSLLLHSFTAAEGGGFPIRRRRRPKVALTAPLPRRAREIPPKTGVRESNCITFTITYKTHTHTWVWGKTGTSLFQWLIHINRNLNILPLSHWFRNKSNSIWLKLNRIMVLSKIILTIFKVSALIQLSWTNLMEQEGSIKAETSTYQWLTQTNRNRNVLLLFEWFGTKRNSVRFGGRGWWSLG